MALTTINSGGVKDDSIVNADIKSDAAIALSKLASTPAVLTGSTNNTIVTVTGANAITGEASLTYNGTDALSIDHSATNENSYIKIAADDNRRKTLVFDSGGTTRGVIGIGDSDEASATSLFLSANSNVAGNSPHLVIDSSGNIGQGTATPLTPNGSVVDNPLNGTTTVFTMYGDSPAINLISSTTTSDDWSLINFGRTGSTSNPYRAVIGYHQSADTLRINANNAITFDVGGAINTSERLRITSDGKVGIGATPVGNLETRDTTRSNIIFAKTGLTVKQNSDLHTSYDTVQLGAGGYLASYNAAATTADTHLGHNVYRDSGGTWKRRYEDTAMRFRMNSPANSFIWERAATGSADADITWVDTMKLDGSARLLIGGATTAQGSTNADDLQIGANDQANQTGITLGSASASSIRWADAANDSAALIWYGHSNGELKLQANGEDNSTYGHIKFKVAASDNSGTSNEITISRGSSGATLAFPNGGGIDFSATSGTGTSELLDDYEEGTWSPTVSSGGTAFTVTGSRYVKIGAQVTLWFDITNGSGSGTSNIYGLPFTPTNVHGNWNIGYYEVGNATTSEDPTHHGGFVDYGTPRLSCRVPGGSVGWTIADSTRLIGCAVYWTTD